MSKKHKIELFFWLSVMIVASVALGYFFCLLREGLL